MPADNVAAKPGASGDPLLRTDYLSGTSPNELHVAAMKLLKGGDGVDNGFLDHGQQAMAGSLPVAVASDQRPARSNIKTAFGRATASGNTSAIAAVTGKKFRVWAFTLQAEGTVTVKWQESTTDRTEQWVFQAREGVVKNPGEPFFLFETTTNNVALNINLSGAIAVNWWIAYEEF